jgi:hypothetical protein
MKVLATQYQVLMADSQPPAKAIDYLDIAGRISTGYVNTIGERYSLREFEASNRI